MYTKNNRKFQNKPVQRSAPRSAAPAPKFKDKKEKFLKETLPCIVLLIFMAFWSIGSALSIIDKIKQPKSNTSMITASAAEGDLVYSAQLDGLRGMFLDDGRVYILTDNSSITFTRNTVGNINTIEFFLGGYSVIVIDSNRLIEGDFTANVVGENYGYELFIRYQYSMLSSVTINHYLESVSYSRLSNNLGLTFVFRDRISFGSVAVGIEISSIDDFPLYLPNYYTQYLAENQLIIDSLQNRISQLEEQIEVNASIIATKDSEIETLNAEIETLNAEIADLQELSNANYTNGYNVGYNDGREIGRIEGIESANDYSFMGLIGAVVDVPVKTFTGLFDWNLLGINLKQFFFSLLSLCTVLLVVKLILR